MTGFAALVLQARGGDELAFRRLVRECEGILRHAASLHYLPGVSNSDDDVWQEALIGLHKAVVSYQPGRSHFRTFAKLVVTRHLHAKVRSANRRKHEIQREARSLDAPVIGPDDTNDTTLGELVADGKPEAVDVLHGRARLRVVASVVNGALSEVEREALIGRVNGESYAEISDRVAAKPKGIDNALQRAERKLRDRLPAA